MEEPVGPVYMDCAATTPIDPEVADVVDFYMRREYGNAGSRTHAFGSRAKAGVRVAARQVAQLVDCLSEEVVFTSGATEANNLALLGLAQWGRQERRMHIVSTSIEHKAVLEPLEHLRGGGFEVDLVAPGGDGRVQAADVLGTVRDDTLLVSMMLVNNETGVIQPVSEVAELLAEHAAFLHTDASQALGRGVEGASHPRVDLVVGSGHKMCGPMGVGVLVARRRAHQRPPLSPQSFGGGQQGGLRPGTTPVPLVAGLGMACELVGRERAARATALKSLGDSAFEMLRDLGAQINGDRQCLAPGIVNASFPGIDSEAVLIALKPHVAISNGAACTSSDYEHSHVLRAMGLPDERVSAALRWSWCHLTPEPDWTAIREGLRPLAIT